MFRRVEVNECAACGGAASGQTGHIRCVLVFMTSHAVARRKLHAAVMMGPGAGGGGKNKNKTMWSTVGGWVLFRVATALLLVTWIIDRGMCMYVQICQKVEG